MLKANQLHHRRVFFAHILRVKDQLGGWAVLYERLYGREGSRKEIQKLQNRFYPERSNPNLDFIAFCLDSLPELANLKAADLFGVGPSK